MRNCILIADDAAMNRMLVREILLNNFEDVTFKEAVNGFEVLKIVKETEIDLIILDLIMPEMDGFEALKQLKKDPNTNPIPVIVNSSVRDVKAIEDTLKAGAVDYFMKPLSPDEMNVILPLKARNALKLYDQYKTINALNHEIQESLKNATAFARIMLPKLYNAKDVKLYIKYKPSMGIGGDFFDCVEKNNRVYFMIADVTGHGIAAGMASSMVKILFRKSIENTRRLPHDILKEINDAIFEYFDFAGKDYHFVFTAFVGMIEGDELFYSNAGHPYPIVVQDHGRKIREILQNGFIVGMFQDAVYEIDKIPFNKKDQLFLYTDGLFCTGQGADITGWTKVREMTENFAPKIKEDPDVFLEEVLYAFHMIHKSKKTDFTDDVAMMILERKG